MTGGTGVVRHSTIDDRSIEPTTFESDAVSRRSRCHESHIRLFPGTQCYELISTLLNDLLRPSFARPQTHWPAVPAGSAGATEAQTSISTNSSEDAIPQTPQARHYRCQSQQLSTIPSRVWTAEGPLHTTRPDSSCQVYPSIQYPDNLNSRACTVPVSTRLPRHDSAMLLDQTRER